MTNSPASTNYEEVQFPARQSCVIRVPASSANIGSGFDCFGISVDLYLIVRVSVADTWSVHTDGAEASGISLDPSSNCLVREFTRTITHRLSIDSDQAFRFDIYNEVPLSRGMGSSATAIIAGISSAYCMAGFDLREKNVLETVCLHAVKVEGHPDNVVPSVFGGLQISVYDPSLNSLTHTKVNFPSDDLSLVIYVPIESSETSTARKKLPPSYDRDLCARAISRAAMLVTVLAQRGPYEPHLKVALADELHEPYRRSISPDFSLLKDESDQRNSNILGVYLSGAGTSTAILCLNQSRSTVIQELCLKYPQLKARGYFRTCLVVDKISLEIDDLPIDISTEASS